MSGQLRIAVVDIDDVEGERGDETQDAPDASAIEPAEREVASAPPAVRVTDADHLGRRAASIAARELLALPARLVVPLPLPTTALCRAEGVEAPVVLTTGRQAYAAARKRGWPVFVGSELEAMALAAEHERLVPGDVVRWCARKAEEPGWKLTPAAAHGLGEAAGRKLFFVTRAGPLLERVLRAAGIEVVEVVAGVEEGAELVDGARVVSGAGAADGEAAS